MTKTCKQVAVAGVAVCLLAPALARADIESQLAAFEREAIELGTNLPQPNQTAGGQSQRRLVDAQIAHSLGDYDTAALALYDIATKPGPDQEVATFYLAEALFQKADRGAARTYYDQIVAKNNIASRYHQPSLLRLVEIAIAQRDATIATNALSALDRLPAGTRKPEVPYVRAKYAYFEGKFDEALAYLNEVPKGSSHELQAIYYAATIQVAKKDLSKAIDGFTDLVSKRPKSSNDRRVIELAHLALGRLYYEQGQQTKSIEAYLMIDRHSDLFPDALYEVGWVYVKNKTYDKALRVLELLALSEPNSQKTPTVRLLEGNLRIRKAQIIRQAQITNTIDINNRDTDPSVEYDKAAAVFAETHDLYKPSYDALAKMADSSDPGQYLAQLAGRSQGVFQIVAPIPDAAAAYLREEPEVARVVEIESDLQQAAANIDESESVIARIEAIIASKDHSALYPALQARRARVGQMQDELIKLRAQLADEMVKGGGDATTATRRQLFDQYKAAPSAEQLRSDKAEEERGEYDKIEAIAGEASSAIDSTQAMAVALRKYSGEAKPELASELKTTISQTLDEAAREAAAIEAELAQLRHELQLGRDLAGIGDDSVMRARDARRALKVAQDNEHRALGGSGKNAQLSERAMRLADNLLQTESTIDGTVERGVDQLKATLAQEKQQLAAMRAELAEHSAESRAIGGGVLAASFREVKAKFYDIVVRADVGTIDVAWSQKEDNDDDLKRLSFQRQRELKQLNDEFRDVIHPVGEPAKKPVVPPPPPPGAGQQTGSPDKATGGDRVKPGGEQPKEPAKPNVRPDNETPKPAPKKGGGR